MHNEEVTNLVYLNYLEQLFYCSKLLNPVVENIAVETVEIPHIPIPESTSLPTINYETEVSAMITNVGKECSQSLWAVLK